MRKSFLIISLAAILFHVWGALRPVHENWGVHYFAFYSLPVTLLALTIAILLIIPPIQLKILRALDAMTRSVVRVPQLLLFTLLGAIWIALLFLFPARAHLLGDSSLIIELTPTTSAIRDSTANFRNQPLTYSLLRTAQSAIGGGTRLETHDLYIIADAVCGVIFLVLLALLLRSLTLPARDKILLSSILIFCAGSQLFFGYVENYVFLYVMIHAYVASTWLAMNNKLHVAVPIVILVLMIGFHLGALVFLPTLVAFFPAFDKNNRSRSIVMTALIAGFLLILLALTGYTTGVIWQRMVSALRYDFLPLTTPPWGVPYGMFSLLHLVDWGNALLHFMPVEAFMLAVLLIVLRTTINWRDPVVRFLLLSSFCGAAFTFMLIPALGMARDWDLLSSFFVPIRFLSLYLLLISIETEGIRPALVGMLGIMLLHAAAWIGVNANEERHLRRAELLTTPVLSGTFPKIYYEHLAVRFYELGEYQRSKRWYEAYMAADSNNVRIVANLSMVYEKLGDDDRQFEMLQRSVDLQTPNPAIYSNLAAGYLERGDAVSSIRLLQQAIVIDSNFYIAHANLALIYSNKHNYRLAADNAERAIALGMNEPGPFKIAGISRVRLNENREALPFFDRYLVMVPSDTNVAGLRKRILGKIQ